MIPIKYSEINVDNLCASDFSSLLPMYCGGEGLGPSAKKKTHSILLKKAAIQRLHYHLLSKFHFTTTNLLLKEKLHIEITVFSLIKPFPAVTRPTIVPTNDTITEGDKFVVTLTAQ